MNEKIYDLEAEKAVIGSLFLEPSRTMNILQSRGCKSEWFFYPETRNVFDACMLVLMTHGKIDPVLVKHNIPNSTSDFTVTLAQWCDIAVPAHVLYHANILKQKYELRCIADLCKETMEKVHGINGPTANFVSEVRHKLAMIPSDMKKLSTMDDIVANAKRAAAEAKIHGGSGIASRWYRLRQAFGGYPKGKITLIGARPGQGKTTYLNNEISAAVLRGIPCAVASMEMTAEEWLINAACAEGGLDACRFKDGLFDEVEMAIFDQWADKFAKAPLYINDDTHTISSLCSFMRDVAADKKVELFGFDYLQMIVPEKAARTRNEEVAGISNAIVTTAKQLPQMAVLGVAQLNRSPATDKHREPEMSDFRDSGALEQDAYMGVLIFQDKRNGSDEELDDDAPTIIKIAKRRGGKTGKYGMVFKKTHQKFIE